MAQPLARHSKNLSVFFGGGSLSIFAPHNIWRIPTFMFKNVAGGFEDRFASKNQCMFFVGRGLVPKLCQDSSSNKHSLRPECSRSKFFKRWPTLRRVFNRRNWPPLCVCWNWSTNLANGIRLDPCSTNVVDLRPLRQIVHGHFRYLSKRFTK